MCQTCIGCGKCTGTSHPGFAAGECPICGSVSDPDSRVCSKCGAPLPKAPGK